MIIKAQSKIAILTSTYERPDLVLRCLRSAINQNYENWELYLINDGSEKDYSEVEKLIAENPRIKYYKFDYNKGLNAARNFGLERILDSDCDYFIVVDDDDLLSENALLLMNETVESYPGDRWLMFNVENITKDYPYHQKPFEKVERVKYPEEFRQKFTGDRAHLFKVDCIKENKCIRFITRIKNGSEITFFYKLSRYTQPLLINKIVKAIEYQPDGLSDTGRREFNYFRHAKVAALHILEVPDSYYFYLEFIKHIINIKPIIRPLKPPYGKRIRSFLKKILGDKYYQIKALFKKENK